MTTLVTLLSPLALLLPALADGVADASPVDDIAGAVPERSPPLPPPSIAPQAFRAFDHARRASWPQQVRIQQRVIIRIAPSSAEARERLKELMNNSPSANSFQERQLKSCIEIDSIAEVQPTEENRLVLFMRDRRVLTAELDRSCNARDFYSGFYIERNEDGRLCSRRDELQSRTGASCRVSQLNRLVATRD